MFFSTTRVRAGRGCVPVLHLHGHLLHPDSIVLLEGDHIGALNHSDYRHVRLGVLFAESTTPMLGYGLGDVNVQTALAYASAYRNPSSELHASDVRRLIFLNRNASPSAVAHMDAGGAVVIEETDMVVLLDAIVKKRQDRQGEWDKARAEVDDVVKQEGSLALFCVDASFRRYLIDNTKRIPALLGASATQPLCRRHWPLPRGRPPRLTDGITTQSGLAQLDIFEHWPLGFIPPPLLEHVATELGRLASYIDLSGQRATGYAWDATELWTKRKSVLSNRPAPLAALRNHAERHGAFKLKNLLITC